MATSGIGAWEEASLLSILMLFDFGDIVGHGDEEVLGLFDPRCTEQRIKEEEKRAEEKQNSKLFFILSMIVISLFFHLPLQVSLFTLI